MAYTLTQVLPDILAHLRPPFPHAHSICYTNFHVNYNVDDLVTCALVCRDWSWPARVALFREIMLMRPPPAHAGSPGPTGEFRPEILAAGSRIRAERLVLALHAQPSLARATRALCLTCNDAALPYLQAILEACQNVHSLLVSFDSEERHIAVAPSALLSLLAPAPSVRLLGAVWECGWQDGYAAAHNAFPELRILHVRGKSFVRGGVPILPAVSPHGIHLSELRLGACIAAEDRQFCERLAELCTIRVLRVGYLQNVEDCILPFAGTLQELDIMELRGLYIDQLTIIARSCRQLRRFNTRNYIYMPTTLPPNVEHFECEPRLLLLFHDAVNMFKLLRSLVRLRRITLYNNHDIHAGITSEGERILQDMAPLLGVEIELLSLSKHACLNRFWGYQ